MSLCEWIKALLSNFCVKIFSQNSLIPIQILNGFFIFYCATWVMQKPNRNSTTALALCGGYYLQITKLKAFEISSVCLFTFLKIEINHWEILETVRRKVLLLCNDMAWGRDRTWSLTILRLSLQYTPIVPRIGSFVAQSVCIEATIVGLLGTRFDPCLKPCRCIKKRFYFRLFLITYRERNMEFFKWCF